MDEALIADDDLLLRMVLRTALERRGVAVTEAGDGDELLGLLEARRYALCIMDARMPGPDLADRITTMREIAPDMPVIVLTGFPDLPEGVLRLGLLVARKPIDLASLDSLLAQTGLDRPALAGAVR